MLRDALDAFVRRDIELAEAVLAEDDELDALEVADLPRAADLHAAATRRTIEPALDLILISRHLERIGDHATNVAEDVIFMVSARDVRHHGPARRHATTDAGVDPSVHIRLALRRSNRVRHGCRPDADVQWVGWIDLRVCVLCQHASGRAAVAPVLQPALPGSTTRRGGPRPYRVLGRRSTADDRRARPIR